MLNIPTDLLRTLIFVIDLRSFTKAALALGVTQPAVSAQIKRLQSLLGYELLDKSAPGVSLTPRGEAVVAHARRLLSVNDQILHLAGTQPSTQMLRVGIPWDYAGARIPATLARFRLRWPEIRFHVSSGTYDGMLRDLAQGELDLVFAVSAGEPAVEARHVWTRQTYWVRSDATIIDPEGPVPLVTYGEDCACQRVAVAALHGAGRECDFVFTSRSMLSLAAAVTAGFGVMAMPPGRVTRTNLTIWEDAPLPKLPEIYCGVFLPEGNNRPVLEELADRLAADVRAPPMMPGLYEMPTAVTPMRASKSV
jgi:DNA-binding transcriptional LysR family regulator